MRNFDIYTCYFFICPVVDIRYLNHHVSTMYVSKIIFLSET